MAAVSVVIGAASDIGRATCAELAARGDRVAAVLRRSGTPWVHGDGQPPPARLLECELSEPNAVEALFLQLRDDRPSHLVYVAGHHRMAALSAAGDGGLQSHWEVNVRAALDACRHFSSARNSLADAPRSITLVASIAHRLGEAGLTAYSASKAALVAAARSMAVEFARKGIRVNTVSPGWIEGRKARAVRAALPPERHAELLALYPLGPGQPEDVAQAIDFLSSPRARWITGIDLVVDGGRTCI